MVDNVKLELLSPNLIVILNEILNNQNLCKYLTYNVNNPLSQTNLTLPANSLMFDKVFPYPFDVEAETEDSSRIHVYYPDGMLKNGSIIEDTTIFFDIVVAKKLWLINDGQPAIRPYEIMKEIIGLFNKKSISTVGMLHFKRFTHLQVNSEFHAIRLTAKMMTV